MALGINGSPRTLNSAALLLPPICVGRVSSSSCRGGRYNLAQPAYRGTRYFEGTIWEMAMPAYCDPKSIPDYFVLMIDYGRAGKEAIVVPEEDRDDIVGHARIVINEGRLGIAWVHHVRSQVEVIDDITEEILREASEPRVSA